VSRRAPILNLCKEKKTLIYYLTLGIKRILISHQGPKEKFLKKVQSFSDYLYIIANNIVWNCDEHSCLFFLLFLWLEAYNCRYHFLWGTTVCHWVSCHRLSIYLNKHIFSGLRLGNFYQLSLNNTFVSKRPETSYPKAWRQNPEERLPQLGGCETLKETTFFFF